MTHLDLLAQASTSAIQQNPFSNLLGEYFAIRSWIFGIIGFIVVAILHAKKKVTLFTDKTDALLTIFAPVIAGLPTLAVALVLYLLAVPENALATSIAVVYVISLIYMLGCSFKAARHANPNGYLGFLATCYARCFSVIVVLGLIVGIFKALSPNKQRSQRASQFELDYMWAKSLAAMSLAYAGLVWIVVRLARNDEFSSARKWLAFKG